MYKNIHEHTIYSSNPQNDKRLSAISLLFGRHTKLYNYLIHPESQWLRDEPEALLNNAGGFSTGEQILIRVGLDLCFDLSDSSLWDVVNRLDSDNFQNVIEALIYLRSS